MLVDKPAWVAHEGSKEIMSLDIHPKGSRMATCSMDIRIWNMRPILDPAAEEDASIPKCLATLADHQSSVNVLRFSHCGNFLATASDMVVIYELRPGKGTASLGIRVSNVENWKVKEVLRGHQLNVVDLNWSRSGHFLASASYDNKVIVWNMEGKHALQVATLEHEGYAKGVAWDPMNNYLASQGDDGLRVWRTATWSQEAHLFKPFQEALKQNYHLRLDWTPDGTYIVAVNAFNKRTNSNLAVLIKRESWALANTSLVGHVGPVVALRNNPKLFYLPRAVIEGSNKNTGQQQEQQMEPQPVGGSSSGSGPGQQQQQNGEAQGLVFDMDASIVIAACSQDRSFSVWTSMMSRPLLVASKCFTKSVLDAAWTPDGYNLIVASHDGTVCLCRFGEHELGRPISAEAFQTLIAEEYGDPLVANRQLVEDATHDALLEQQQQPAQASTMMAGARLLPSASGAAAVARQLPASAAGGPMGSLGGVGPSAVAAAAGSRNDALASRIMPHGAAATTSLGGDKRKRVEPVAVEPVKGPGQSMCPPPAKRPMLASSAGPSKVSGAGSGAAPRVPPAAAAGSGGISAGVDAASPAPGTASRSGVCLLPEPEVRGELCQVLGQSKAGLAQPPGELVLYAQNSRSTRPGGPLATLKLTAGGTQMWVDAVPGQVVALTGTALYTAVALKGGELQVYTPMGRHMLPALALGHSPALMQASGDWHLIVITVDGQLTVMDLQQVHTSIEVSLQPILRPGVWVSEIFMASQLKQEKVPLVVLSNGSAWGYCGPLNRWMKLADAGHQVSAFKSAIPGASLHGDLARLHTAVSKFPAPDAFTQCLEQDYGLRQSHTRAALEQWFASAMVLQDVIELRRALHMYVNHLVMANDKDRLFELINDLMGPERWLPGHPWEPNLCSLNKRRLIREEILPQMGGAMNRHMQEVRQRLDAADDFLKSSADRRKVHPFMHDFADDRLLLNGADQGANAGPPQTQ